MNYFKNVIFLTVFVAMSSCSTPPPPAQTADSADPQSQPAPKCKMGQVVNSQGVCTDKYPMDKPIRKGVRF